MSSYDPQFYQTQYELIKSRKLADRVATELNLAQTDFVGNPQASLLDKIGRQSGGVIARDAAALKDRHDTAVEQIMDGLSVQPVLQSTYRAHSLREHQSRVGATDQRRRCRAI